MAIKGRTDILPKPGDKLVEIGRLYKGSPQIEKTKPDGTKYKVVGKDLPYFRMEFNERFKHLSLLWWEMYGDKPTKFDFVFLAGGDTVDEVFPTWYESHKASKMLARCDGETIVRSLDPRGWMTNLPKPCDGSKDEAGDFSCSLGCKNIGRLHLIFYEFNILAGVWGYIGISIGSAIEIDQHLFPAIASCYQTFGRVAKIPFNFGRAEREVNMRAHGKNAKPGDRVNAKFSLCYLEVNPDYMKKVLIPGLYGDVPDLPMLSDKAVSQPAELPDTDDGETPLLESKVIFGQWDYENVVNKTSPRFPDPDVQRAFIIDLMNAETLRPEMTTEQVIGIINDLWEPDPDMRPGWQSAESLAAFLSAAQNVLGMNEPQVINALNRVYIAFDGNAPALMSVYDWKAGKLDAWAACIAASMDYDPAGSMPAKTGPKTVERVIFMCEVVKAAKGA